MAVTFFFIVLLVFNLPVANLGFFFRTKVLSPTSNVHVDIVNHVQSALDDHPHEFHHSWRDYTIVLLLVLVLGGCCCSCCIGFYFYVSRRLRAHLNPRTSSTTTVATIPFTHHLT